jgi:hypothetical protein
MSSTPVPCHLRRSQPGGSPPVRLQPARLRLLPIGALLIVAAISLAACSSSKSGSGNSTTSSTASGGTKSSSPSGTSGLATTSTSSSSGSGEIGGLINKISSAKQLTFGATYSAVTSGSAAKTETFTYAQMPPKSVFEVSGIKVIDTGTATYSCSSASGTPTCISEGTGDPLADTLNFITGDTALTALNALKTGIAQKLPNFSATYSTATYAGQSAQCVSGTESTNTYKYCITDSGVLAYAAGTSTSGFGGLTLSAFSTNVSSSEFSLPPGATVVTTPSAP